VKESCNPSGKGAKEESEKSSKEATASKLPVVGGGIGGERIRDGGKNCTRKTVEKTPEGAGEVFWGEGGKDGNEKADRGVGEKKAGREEGGSMDGKPLKPWPECGEKPEEAAGPDGAPRDLHRARMPVEVRSGKPAG
jgi:hypothetical protein